MNTFRKLVVILFLVAVLPAAMRSWGFSQRAELPPFGRDTVLVWKLQTSENVTDFVVRIAEFLPNRFIEWENATTQGTIFMSNKAVTGARLFLNSRLFEAGVDTQRDDATTLWLSRQAFRDLKARKKIKLMLDSVEGWVSLEGTGHLDVEVNRSSMTLPVMQVKDDRGSERWFLDQEDNPLLMKHTVRTFSQTLHSITTDRKNTLRWIKGKMLTNPHRFD